MRRSISIELSTFGGEMKNIIILLTIGFIGGILGTGLINFLLKPNIASAQNERTPNIITASEIRLVNSEGKIIGYFKADETGRPELHLKSGIYETSISPHGLHATVSGKDEVNRTLVGPGIIELGIYNAHDPLGFTKIHHRMELSAGKLNTHHPSISIWDSYLKLIWSTP